MNRIAFPKASTALRNIVALSLVSLLTASAQEKAITNPSPTKQDTDTAILETLKAIQGELHEMKVLLATRPAQQAAAAPAGAQQSVVLDVSNRPFRGDKSAPVTMVEITDYQCPFCGRHARETLPQIEKDYIDTGKVKYYVLDLPLEALHRDAFKAATAVRCANEQGKYWEMHDQLFANQQALSEWDARAAAIHLDTAQFDACLASGKYDAAIRKDIGQTEAAGVSGTPGFYFATTGDDSSKIKTVKFVNGARPFAAFKAELDTLLKPKA